jgi:Mrp family chromosome partitioning ATPase
MRSIRPEENRLWTADPDVDDDADTIEREVILPPHSVPSMDPDATQKLLIDNLSDGHPGTVQIIERHPASHAPQRRVQVITDAAEARLPVEVATLLEEQADVISERILCHDLTDQALAGQRAELRYGGGRGGGGLHHGAATRSCVIGVTSAVAGEGKTTAALHIANAVAQNSYKRVCLIDLSFGDDTVARRLGLSSDETAGGGLTELIESSDGHDAAAVIGLLRMVRLPGLDNLVVIPGGRSPRRPARAAHSPWIPEVVSALRERFDIVIVDLPSVGSGQALPLLPMMTGVVVVAAAGVTPKAAVDEALDRIGRAHVMGVILNGTRSHLPNWLRRRFEAKAAA